MKRMRSIRNHLSIVIATSISGLAAASIHHTSILLYPRDAQDHILDQAPQWGELTYIPVAERFAYTFEGHGMSPRTSYQLVYWPDTVPFQAGWAKCLGSPLWSDANGDVHMSHRTAVDTDGDLPISPPDVNPGARLWLVPTHAVVCATGTLWFVFEDEFLMDTELITFHQV
mmetsp:Transcript_1310/g.2597  ORF Transcript_1310/g.2597 Transcript_1310/m.2597 type:complete len:171 (+) Transcript_1310:738-1250(+)